MKLASPKGEPLYRLHGLGERSLSQRLAIDRHAIAVIRGIDIQIDLVPLIRFVGLQGPGLTAIQSHNLAARGKHQPDRASAEPIQHFDFEPPVIRLLRIYLETQCADLPSSKTR